MRERAYAVAIVTIVALGKEVCQRMGTMKNWLCVLGTYLVIVVVVRHDGGVFDEFG
jgi:hypothetical protein